MAHLHNRAYMYHKGKDIYAIVASTDEAAKLEKYGFELAEKFGKAVDKCATFFHGTKSNGCRCITGHDDMEKMVKMGFVTTFDALPDVEKKTEPEPKNKPRQRMDDHIDDHRKNHR